VTFGRAAQCSLPGLLERWPVVLVNRPFVLLASAMRTYRDSVERPGPPIDLPSRPVFNPNVVSIVVGSRGFDSMNAHRMVFGGGVGLVVGGVASSFSVFGCRYSQSSMTETSRTDVSAQRLKARPRQLDLAAPATSSGHAHDERVGEGYSLCDERIEVDLVGIVEDNREEKPIRLGLEQYECHWNVEPF
jgi:hypothetical protein